MEIRSFRNWFEAFKWKLEPFEMDSKDSNGNSRLLKRIRWIQIQIRNIRKVFEAFESKFKPFERDSKHLNQNSNHSNGIWSIRIHIRNIRRWFEAFESISNTSNEIPFIWMQIRTIRKGFEGLWLGLVLAPWLVPCETTQKRLFAEKRPKNYDFGCCCVKNNHKFAKTEVTSKSTKNRLVN